MLYYSINNMSIFTSRIKDHVNIVKKTKRQTTQVVMGSRSDNNIERIAGSGSGGDSDCGGDGGGRQTSNSERQSER